MLGRGTLQNLRNLEAISLRLELLAMVNAEILSTTKIWAEQNTLHSFANGALVKSRIGANVCSWHLLSGQVRLVANNRHRRLTQLRRWPATRTAMKSRRRITDHASDILRARVSNFAVLVQADDVSFGVKS
jgi:hypothetical protein